MLSESTQGEETACAKAKARKCGKEKPHGGDVSEHTEREKAGEGGRSQITEEI